MKRRLLLLVAMVILAAWTHGAGFLTNNAQVQLTTDGGQVLYPGR